MLQPRSAKLLYVEFRRCRDGQRSRHVINHPTQLSLAIRSWVGAMSTQISISWEGKPQVWRCTGHVFCLRHRGISIYGLNGLVREISTRPCLCSFGLWHCTFTFIRKHDMLAIILLLSRPISQQLRCPLIPTETNEIRKSLKSPKCRKSEVGILNLNRIKTYQWANNFFKLLAIK